MSQLAASAAHRRYVMIGWLEAAGNVAAIGALSLTYAVGHVIGAHPVAFILYAMIASSTGMLTIAGVDGDTRAIAVNPRSWLIGATIILIEICYYLTLAHVPPAHGNLVLRIGIPIAMVVGWVLYDRRPPRLALVGGVVIVAATAFVVGMTDPAVRVSMALAGTLAAVFMVVRGFTLEFHAWNRAAKTVREKLRVTGTLVLVTSVLGLVAAGVVASFIAAGWVPPNRVAPALADMLHGPTILLGCLAGGPVLTLMAYLGFSSVVKIGTANNMASMAFAPVTTWVFQELGVAAGLIVAARPDGWLIGAISAIVVAVLLIFWAGRRQTIARA